MKELGEANKILDNEKSVKMPLGGHFKLSLKDCPVRDCDVERMSKVSYLLETANVFECMGQIMHGNHVDVIVTKRICVRMEGNATTRGGSFNYIGGVYGPYGGYDGSYLAKGSLGRVRRRA
ncbi:hypothetical protein Tco_1048587 [Tanacetum coccineum]